MTDEVDDLLSALVANLSVTDQTPVLNVDRDRSTRQRNRLSDELGMYTALVYKREDDLLLAYPNIHYPKAYSRKVRECNPDVEVVTLRTVTWVSTGRSVLVEFIVFIVTFNFHPI